MTPAIYDLAIVGGGINGAGIAADAAGRGLKVLLAEMGDLGGATSSASSKLVHGGLRYLETYEFRLVREALAEREILLAAAPHIVWPLRFVLPHVPGMRPAWLIRSGLFLYDHLARRRRVPGSCAMNLRTDPAGRPLNPTYTRSFAYWDCWVDDARLVVLNAIAAAGHGADILTRTRVTGLIRDGALWRIRLSGDNAVGEVWARAVVNAAGPWASGIATMAAGNRCRPAPRSRLVKGSHIVVPRIAGAEDAYLLQGGDGRAVFALPFEERFTLIGTTDVAFEGDPATARISADEEAYLLDVSGAFFRVPIHSADIVWNFSGVRPLYDDGGCNPSKVTRDYHLDVDREPGEAPLVTVLGGKITTYRRLAEAVLDLLRPEFLDMKPAFTAGAALPGGGIGDGGMAMFVERLRECRQGFSGSFLTRLARRYGTLTDRVIGDARDQSEMGEDFGAGLTEREVVYLAHNEWARTPEDVLWRRTKAGLHMSDSQRSTVSERIARVL